MVILNSLFQSKLLLVPQTCEDKSNNNEANSRDIHINPRKLLIANWTWGDIIEFANYHLVCNYVLLFL